MEEIPRKQERTKLFMFQKLAEGDVFCNDTLAVAGPRVTCLSGVHVAFGENNGENWQNITTLLMSKPGGPQRSCCYTEIVATGSYQVTVFYSAPRDWSDETARNPRDPQQRQHFRLYARNIRIDRI